MRIKNVELVALGFVTLEKPTLIFADGAVELLAFSNRNSPPVAVLTIQPEAAPRLVGWDVRVDEVDEKPDAGVQVPLAVVQAAKPADLMTVADGTVNVKVYVVLALANELPITTLRGVI